MSKDIIVTKLTLDVGKVYRGLTRGPHLEPRPEQCYLVIGEATENDWVESLVSYGEERAWLEMLICINRPLNYYEILTD